MSTHCSYWGFLKCRTLLNRQRLPDTSLATMRQPALPLSRYWRASIITNCFFELVSYSEHAEYRSELQGMTTDWCSGCGHYITVSDGLADGSSVSAEVVDTHHPLGWHGLDLCCTVLCLVGRPRTSQHCRGNDNIGSNGAIGLRDLPDVHWLYINMLLPPGHRPLAGFFYFIKFKCYDQNVFFRQRYPTLHV